jgi:hypothetical protein
MLRNFICISFGKVMAQWKLQFLFLFPIDEHLIGSVEIYRAVSYYYEAIAI